MLRTPRGALTLNPAKQSRSGTLKGVGRRSQSFRNRQNRRRFKPTAAPQPQVSCAEGRIGGEIPREPSTTLDDRCSGAGAPRAETVPRPVVSPVQILSTRWGLFPSTRAPPSGERGRCRPNTTPGDDRRELSRPVTTPGDDPALPLVRFRYKRRPRGRHLLRAESTWLGSMDLLAGRDTPRPSSPRPLGAPGAPPSDPDGSPGAPRGQIRLFDVGTRSSPSQLPPRSRS
jgi:hypothetical protein